MKKIVSVLLILCMMLTCFAALAEDAVYRLTCNNILCVV